MNIFNDWLVAYNSSHLNPTNRKIHLICIPLIYIAVIGMGMNLSSGLTNIALVVLLIYYFTLDRVLPWAMLVFTLAVLYVIENLDKGLIFYLLMLAIAWAVRIHGYQLEGKKPAFLSDFKSIIMEPLWVMDDLFRRYRR